MTYEVSPNATGSTRTAVITVAGQSHTVTQAPCTYSISPPSRSVSSSGGTESISVTSSETTCSWTATESSGWINITPGSSGSGDGTVTYTVSANTTGSSRTAVITVAGQTHTVTQQPEPIISGYALTASGGPLSGVTLTFSNNGGTATTNPSGFYSQAVPYGWSGTVTPSLSCWGFALARSYSNVTSNQSNQNYTGTPITPVISGYALTLSGAPISGVTLTFSNNGGTATTDSSGYYSGIYFLRLERHGNAFQEWLYFQPSL